MKKIMLVITILFAMGCTGVQKKDEVVIPDYEVNNLEIKEGESKLTLSWELPKDKDVEEIYIMKRGQSGIDRKRIEADKKEITFETPPFIENLFIVKVVNSHGRESKGVRIKGTAKLETVLRNPKEFIDLDSETVRFLFRSNPGAAVKFYVGESRDNLKLAEEDNNYDYKKGLKVSGFEPGKKYFYKIEVEHKDKKVESEVLSFEKIDRKDVENVEWAKDAVFYEIFVRSFYDGNGDKIGDFKGLTKRLDYVEDLGVDALWLMPTFESPSYHGYDIVDYYSIEEDYGTMEDFDKFLDEAHKRGIKVILDLVINHSSLDHPWMKKALEDKESKYYDYYVWADEFDNIDETGEWDQQIWSYSGKAKEHYMGIFWSGMPDLNLRNPDVRKEMKDIAKFWLEKGVDGFRLDASKHIDDENKEVTLNWWKEFNSFVKQVNPEAYLVGENWDSDYSVIAPFFETMDSSFNFGINGTIVSLADGNKINAVQELNKMYDIYEEYNENFIDATFIKNHDMDRVASDLDGNKDKIKLAGTILMTLPGTPFIYYGEELGQEGMKPDDNIREPFDWYADAQGEGMTSMNVGGFYNGMKYTEPNDGISLEEQMKDPESVYTHYKKLIEIRQSTNAFSRGGYKELEMEDGLYGYALGYEDEGYIVIHNISDEQKSLDLEGAKGIGFEVEELLNGKSMEDDLNLNGYESVIIRLTESK
ncbi:MAG: alpha-amylase family glycosyl hydrolase [Fusobacteriota bacterium]